MLNFDMGITHYPSDRRSANTAWLAGEPACVAVFSRIAGHNPSPPKLDPDPRSGRQIWPHLFPRARVKLTLR
jgi:hypothetical protein